ncbi:MAG: DNA adenine methylase, partial [Rhodobacteraceae bacterium]|nr:DNA adenine methylase [Paracoccaceae bacterium]
MRYAGGKSLAVGYIVEHIPNNIDKIVSPFIGGGSVEIACANELGLKVQGYDVFDILTNYWKVQLR